MEATYPAFEDSESETRAHDLTEADRGAADSSAAQARTPQLVGAAVGDRCSNCRAPLAGDQSYCLNCGERRAKARFSFASMTAAQAATPARPPREPRRPRFSSSATLVTGIGTLLLAMGVGVLIGEQGKNNQRVPAAAAPQVITVQGGGGSAAAASTPSATTTPTGSARKKGKTTKVVITKKIQAKAAVAATKALGGANLAAPTSTIGSSCSGGQAGCQNGKFTGTFFGP